MNAVHFGAGNIGRGLIGEVLHDSHFYIQFLDTDPQIIKQLRDDRSYEIRYLDRQLSTKTIDNVSAINSATDREHALRALADADIITTSVGANNLEKIAALLHDGMLSLCHNSRRVNVLANENMINASSSLREHIYDLSEPEERRLFDQHFSFVDTAIDRQSLSCVVEGKKVAVVEPYFEWVISNNQIPTDTPYRIQGASYVDDMTPFIERKLFIVNASHAAFAYTGALFHYETVQQAISDTDINTAVRSFLMENFQYFVNQYSWAEEEMLEFIKQTLNRHGNPQIADEIKRVGRSPLRKLDQHDRLVCPVLKLEQLGLKNEMGKRMIAAAYLYENSQDPEAVVLQKEIQRYGYASTICKRSNIAEPLAREIAGLCFALKKNAQLLFKNGEIR